VLGKARELARTPGIAFSLQGWLLVIVGGAVVGSVLSEDMAARERTREA
jgi:hypothetical protein